MTDFLMPRLAESMEEGTILSWLIADGDYVSKGDELVEIETDKTTVTQVSDAEGVLRVVLPEGSRCDVGVIIAKIGDDSEPFDALPETRSVTLLTTAQPDSDSVSALTTEVAATPLARRSARTHGVSLESVLGTGPRGRVTQSDVFAAAGLKRPLTRNSASSGDSKHLLPAPRRMSGSGPEKGEITTIELTKHQSVVAERMVLANTTIPAFQIQTEVLLDEVMNMRKRMKGLVDNHVAPTMNDFVIRACGVSLRTEPLVNAALIAGKIEYHGRINVGFAVAGDGVLMVPTIFDADAKTLMTIAIETRDLIDRVRTTSVSPADLSGGTFTVSNLGMYGVTP